MAWLRVWMVASGVEPSLLDRRRRPMTRWMSTGAFSNTVSWRVDDPAQGGAWDGARGPSKVADSSWGSLLRGRTPVDDGLTTSREPYHGLEEGCKRLATHDDVDV